MCIESQVCIVGVWESSLESHGAVQSSWLLHYLWDDYEWSLFYPYPSPFPRLLRCKRTWQARSSNDSNDNDDWNTSKYFAKLTEVMADPLSSLSPRTELGFLQHYCHSGRFWKLCFLSLTFFCHLIFEFKEEICNHVPSDEFQSLKLVDISVSKDTFPPSLYAGWVWSIPSHEVVSDVCGTVALFTLVHLIIVIPWWQWYDYMYDYTRVQVLQGTWDSHGCNQELNIHSKISGKNWWMSNTPSLAQKMIPKCYHSVWINAFMEH